MEPKNLKGLVACARSVGTAKEEEGGEGGKAESVTRVSPCPHKTRRQFESPPPRRAAADLAPLFCSFFAFRGKPNKGFGPFRPKKEEMDG